MKPPRNTLASPLRRCCVALAMLMLATAGLPVALAAEPAVLAVIVRHAEKAAEPASDPSLTDAGQERARRLASLLADADVEAIYSTPYRRTRQTGQPLADRLGLEVTLRPIGDLSVAAHSKALASEVVENHAGGAVLIVGHSNTVPALVEALSGRAVGPIADDDYERIYIVTAAAPGRGRAIEAAYPAD